MSWVANEDIWGKRERERAQTEKKVIREVSFLNKLFLMFRPEHSHCELMSGFPFPMSHFSFLFPTGETFLLHASPIPKFVFQFIQHIMSLISIVYFQMLTGWTYLLLPSTSLAMPLA